MASSSLHSRTTALCIFSLPLLLITFSQTALPQAPSPSSSSSSGPTAGSCQPQLLSLVPCAPFVQGMVQSPTGSCCNNLNQIYRQQPSCICLLLRNSNFNALPINGTLALQLPQLCHLRGDASDCSGSYISSPHSLFNPPYNKDNISIFINFCYSASMIWVLCHFNAGVPAAPTLPSEKAPNSTATQVSFGARNESSIACEQ